MPKIKMNNETIELVTVSRKQLDIPWLIQMSWIVTFSGQNRITAAVGGLLSAEVTTTK